MPAPSSDLHTRLTARALGRPWLTVGGVVAAALVLAYRTLIQQELLLAVWLLVSRFLVNLAWGFVRAHERLAGAADRLTEAGECPTAEERLTVTRRPR